MDVERITDWHKVIGPMWSTIKNQLFLCAPALQAIVVNNCSAERAEKKIVGKTTFACLFLCFRVFIVIVCCIQPTCAYFLNQFM